MPKSTCQKVQLIGNKSTCQKNFEHKYSIVLREAKVESTRKMEEYDGETQGAIRTIRMYLLGVLAPVELLSIHPSLNG